MAKQMNKPQPQRSESMYASYDRNHLNEPDWTGEQPPATDYRKEGDVTCPANQSSNMSTDAIPQGSKSESNVQPADSEQPPATEQEWTPQGRFICRSHGAMGNVTVGAAASEEDASKLISAHNAALAAANRKSAEWATTAAEEGAKNIELKTQLATLVDALRELREYAEAWGEPELVAKIDALVKEKEAK
jgi:hypothetical protein